MYQMEELLLSDSQKCQKISEILECLIISDRNVERIKDVFKSEMELALNMEASSLQMENTYIPELPDGTESGVYLAMDLGGTNLRVMLLTLSEGEVINESVQHFNLTDDVRIGCGEALFDYLAECVDAFAVQHKLKDNVIYPLGFTFSFPMRQNGLDSGILVTWTKTFNCPSIVNEDVVQILRQSLRKCKRTNIEVFAILNDTTGTLMHGALLDKRTRIGVVLGTGSNACYMEQSERVKHWNQERHGEQHVVIDIEWGAFGDNGVLDFIKTKFDEILDNSSLLKNSFTFEKYISGKYLGELCRIILHHLHSQRLFLVSVPVENLPQPWTFESDNVSKIEQDTVNNTFTSLKNILKSHFHCEDEHSYTQDDLEIVRFVCGLITRRAAQLVSINLAILLNRMDDETNVTIAIDGSVFKHHPRLRQWLSELTAQWAPTKKSTFMLAEDGSGKGAALVAAIADKIRRREC